MSDFQSYYRLLGVNNDASQQEIDEAFDVFVVEKHPSVIRHELEDYSRQCSANNTAPDLLQLEEFNQRYIQAKELYRIACQGYKILSNPEDRFDYDKTLPQEENTSINLSFSQNQILIGSTKKGDVVVDSFIISLVSGNVTKKRFGLKYPEWVSCTFTDTNGRLPITIQVSVDTAQLPIGDSKGSITFSVGDDDFFIPVSITVYDPVPIQGSTLPTVVIPPPFGTQQQSSPSVVEAVDIRLWRRKWIPIFVGIAIIIVLMQVLTPKPIDPFSQFCTRPVVDVSGLHIKVTDNGLFMYGTLSAILIVNGEPLDVPDIPSEIVVHSFIKTIVLSSVYVKTGDHKGETQTCDKTMFPTG